MTIHTSSSWKFSDNTRYWKTNPYSIVVSAKGVHGTTIANIPNRKSIPDEEKMANALLISAAPDMFNALIDLLNSCYDVERDAEIIRAVKQARAAIDKATGL